MIIVSGSSEESRGAYLHCWPHVIEKLLIFRVHVVTVDLKEILRTEILPIGSVMRNVSVDE